MTTCASKDESHATWASAWACRWPLLYPAKNGESISGTQCNALEVFDSRAQCFLGGSHIRVRRKGTSPMRGFWKGPRITISSLMPSEMDIVYNPAVRRPKAIDVPRIDRVSRRNSNWIRWLAVEVPLGGSSFLLLLFYSYYQPAICLSGQSSQPPSSPTSGRLARWTGVLHLRSGEQYGNLGQVGKVGMRGCSATPFNLTLAP